MQWTLLTFVLLQLRVHSQHTTQNGPCPPGGGSFCGSTPNIILRCRWGRLRATDCNQLMATASPQGVKTDAVCGNSSLNNAECYSPPYPDFIHIGGVAGVPTTSKQLTPLTSLESSTSSSHPGGPGALNTLITTSSASDPSLTSSLSASTWTSASEPPIISSPRKASGAFNSNQPNAETSLPTSTLSVAIGASNERGGLPTGTISAIVGSILGGFVLFCIALVVLFIKRDRKKTGVFSTRGTETSTPSRGVILDHSMMETEKAANLDRDPRHSIWGDASADH